LSVSGYGIEKRDFFWKNVVGNAGSIEREWGLNEQKKEAETVCHQSWILLVSVMLGEGWGFILLNLKGAYSRLYAEVLFLSNSKDFCVLDKVTAASFMVETLGFYHIHYVIFKETFFLFVYQLFCLIYLRSQLLGPTIGENRHLSFPIALRGRKHSLWSMMLWIDFPKVPYINETSFHS
jgi:hypothetical protein